MRLAVKETNKEAFFDANGAFVRSSRAESVVDRWVELLDEWRFKTAHEEWSEF